MSRASTVFHRLVRVILFAICTLLPWRSAVSLTQESSPHWVPFVATLVQEVYKPVFSGPPIHGTIAGVYVRNAQGVSYTRRVASTRSALPLQGARDVAFLHDRPNHITYVIDFMRKTIKQERDPTGDPDFAAEPMSRTDFERLHAGDLPLGKQMVSGVECEGFKVADPRHKGKYRGEKWFAPSLNFLLVRYAGRLPDGTEATTLVKDLEPGKEPDPNLFRLPEDFKLEK